jgi:hypothetical protein
MKSSGCATIRALARRFSTRRRRPRAGFIVPA